MAWPLIAMAAVSAVGSVVSANQASAQNEIQQGWNRYNAQMGYNNSMANIESQIMLGMFNAAMQKDVAEYNAKANLDIAKYNADQVTATTEYNSFLLDEELRLMWEAEGLDQRILREQREKERGDIVGAQASSGVTIGYGSHDDVVVAQRAAEMKDAFVIRHNADIGAAKLLNAKAQGEWQGAMQVQKIMYEGQMGSAMSLNNAKMGAASTMMETIISGQANTRTAGYQLNAGMSGATEAFSSNQAQISSNLTSGLFSAASQGVGAYYSDKAIPSLVTDDGAS